MCRSQFGKQPTQLVARCVTSGLAWCQVLWKVSDIRWRYEIGAKFLPHFWTRPPPRKFSTSVCTFPRQLTMRDKFQYEKHLRYIFLLYFSDFKVVEWGKNIISTYMAQMSGIFFLPKYSFIVPFISQLIKKLQHWSLYDVIEDILPFVLNTK